MTVTRHAAETLTAVLAFIRSPRGAPSTLELRGPLDPALLDAALARVAADRPELREVRHRLVQHGRSRHVLQLDADYPVGVLADVLTAAAPESAAKHCEDGAVRGGPTRRRPAVRLPVPLALTPLQQELLAAAHCPQQQVGQFLWRWHGPLDTARFTAAWQSVFDQETVLRAAFTWDPQPRLTLHARASPDVVRHAHGTLTRQALMEQERARGFDLGRPGLLRLALLEGAPRQPLPGCVPPHWDRIPATDVVLTYHRTLLDSRSARLLAREFHRAYLAGGAAQGGERRPDLRDYRRWLDTQDPAPARDFWSRTGGDLGAGLPRARSGASTDRQGTGRSVARLSPAEAARLADWAARWGATESSVLQAVWAMILFRARAAGGGPAPVSFSITVSGRGIPMEGIAYVPGPFANPLPMSLRVDPAGTVPGLLRAVRDQALGMAAYEWVSAGQVREWLGFDADADLPDTLLSFEQRSLDGLSPEIPAPDVHVEHPDPAGGQPVFAINVAARHDSLGGLVLTSVHDRGRLHDGPPAVLLSQCIQLLRGLPGTIGESTTIGEVLSWLAEVEVPYLHDRPADPGRQLVLLRGAARAGSGTVCLVAPPGTSDRWHAEVARLCRGPEALAMLRVDPPRIRESLRVVGPLLASNGPLVLGGFSGAGALACELARHLATDVGTAPLVVLGMRCGAGEDGLHELVRALEVAARRTTCASTE